MRRWGEGWGVGGATACHFLERAEKLPVNPKKERQLPITPGGLLCCQLSFQDFSADRLRNAAEKEKLRPLIL
jgi:hypothetical protein